MGPSCRFCSGNRLGLATVFREVGRCLSTLFLNEGDTGGKGNSSFLRTGLRLLGGVIGRNLGLFPSLLADGDGSCSFLTGSKSPSLPFSNIDISLVVGGIDEVSVRSRSVTELASLCAPRLPCRALHVVIAALLIALTCGC
jgi:hypothetical protein